MPRVSSKPPLRDTALHQVEKTSFQGFDRFGVLVVSAFDGSHSLIELTMIAAAERARRSAE